jgi:hypothetical protein
LLDLGLCALLTFAYNVRKTGGFIMLKRLIAFATRSPTLRIEDAPWVMHGADMHSAMHEQKITRRRVGRIAAEIIAKYRMFKLTSAYSRAVPERVLADVSYV